MTAAPSSYVPAPAPGAAPRWADRLGLAGLLPFVAAAAAAWIARGDPAMFPVDPRLGLAAYAATIASFLGGVHWGPAFRDGGRDTVALAWGVCPQLAGWVALLLPLRASLVVSAAVLAACWVADRRLYPAAGLGAWLPLRTRLTIGAVASCLLGAAA